MLCNWLAKGFTVFGVATAAKRCLRHPSTLGRYSDATALEVAERNL